MATISVRVYTNNNKLLYMDDGTTLKYTNTSSPTYSGWKSVDAVSGGNNQYYIGNVSLNFNASGYLPTSYWSGWYGSYSHYRYIYFYYKNYNTNTYDTEVRASQTSAPYYSIPSTWNNGSFSYDFGTVTISGGGNSYTGGPVSRVLTATVSKTANSA